MSGFDLPTVVELRRMGADAGKVLDAIENDLRIARAKASNSVERGAMRTLLSRVAARRRAWAEAA